MRTSSTLRIACALAVAACISLAAAPASAKVKTYLPERFRILVENDGWTQRPLGIQNGSFWVPVKLPVGSRITKVVFFHWGMSASSSYTWVLLSRTKMGLPTSGQDLLFGATETTYTGASTSVEPLKVVAGQIDSSSDTVIRPGYRYFVQVISSSSIVGGVKVFYQEP